jgi:hypothetical protein
MRAGLVPREDRRAGADHRDAIERDAYQSVRRRELLASDPELLADHLLPPLRRHTQIPLPFDLRGEGPLLVDVLRVGRLLEHSRRKEQVRLDKQVARDVEHSSLLRIIEAFEQDQHVDV